MVAKHLQYCQNIVRCVSWLINSLQKPTEIINASRTVDYEGYLCSLFVGPSSAQRNAIFAVRALNAEVATIRDQISEIQAGRLRMAWWKEGIDKTFQVRRRKGGRQGVCSDDFPAYFLYCIAGFAF